MNETLTERSNRLQAQRQEILTEIAGIQRNEEIPKTLLSPNNVRAFSRGLKEKMLDPVSPFAKQYLRLLVDEIRVEEKEVRIRGSHAKLAQAMAQKNPGTPEGVPRFGYAWLPGQDSNLQPSG